jgi:DNA excision repair protein ERCC-4
VEERCEVSADLQLPALASLGGLKDAKPVIIVDTREQNPLVFSRLETRPGILYSGDYSIAGLENSFAIERKSVPDLAACCMGENRQRFERELHRLRGYRFKRLLIVGTELEIQQGVAFSRISPAAIFGTLAAFEVRYDIPAVFRATPELAVSQVERWAFYFARECVEAVNGLRRGTGD